MANAVCPFRCDAILILIVKLPPSAFAFQFFIRFRISSTRIMSHQMMMMMFENQCLRDHALYYTVCVPLIVLYSVKRFIDVDFLLVIGGPPPFWLLSRLRDCSRMYCRFLMIEGKIEQTNNPNYQDCTLCFALKAAIIHTTFLLSSHIPSLELLDFIPPRLCLFVSTVSPESPHAIFPRPTANIYYHGLPNRFALMNPLVVLAAQAETDSPSCDWSDSTVTTNASSSNHANPSPQHCDDNHSNPRNAVPYHHCDVSSLSPTLTHG